MSWATARAALVDLLDGLTIAASGDDGAEELHAHEFPPPGEIGPEELPYAFIPGPERSWTFLPSGLLQTDIPELTLVVYLGPAVSPDWASIERRRERWIEALAPIVIGNQALGGEVGAITGGRAGRAVRFGTDERPVAYGFEMTLQVVYQEIKTAGA